MSSGSLPDLIVGRAEDNSGKDIVISSKNRPRSMVIIGQPGTGKSSLTIQLIQQDINAGCGVLVIEPHDLIKELLPRIPQNRWRDVVIISLRHERPPIWPVLDVARNNSEQLIVANLLIDSWRAQYGRESIGPRAEALLQNALLLFPNNISISPLELMAAIANKQFRDTVLQMQSLEGDRYPLALYWQHSLGALTERTVQEWGQAVANKLSPFLLNDWLRRATCGTAPAATLENLHPSFKPPRVEFRSIYDDPEESHLKMVTWLRDKVLGYRYSSSPRPQICNVEDQLENFLINAYKNNLVYSHVFPDGIEVDHPYQVDGDDSYLRMPSPDELMEYGNVLRNDVDRRRRRRGWAHMVEFVLARKGIAAREAIDIADMLDDKRIILVEVPTIYGSDVTSLAGTMAFLSAVARGHRQLALPPERRVPCSIYIDEASLFLNEAIERTLAELRKADVSLTIVLQRLGQLGASNSPFRRGVIDTIGTIITLPVGIEEVNDVAQMFAEKKDNIHKLIPGHGLISTLTNQGQVGDAIKFAFDKPSLITNKGDEQTLREMSIGRYYQSEEAADAIFKERNRMITRYRGDAGVAKSVKNAKLRHQDDTPEGVNDPIVDI